MIHNVNSREELNSLLKKDMVLLDFWAPWCGPCKMLAPVLEQVAQTLPELTIVKINVDDLPDLAIEYRVRGIPDLRWYKNNVEVKKHSGMLSAQHLEQITRTLT